MDKNEKNILERIFDDDTADAPCCPVSSAPLPKELSFAMAYVPFQQWETPYEDDVALRRATAFPCLDKPFIGEEAVRNGDTE